MELEAAVRLILDLVVVLGVVYLVSGLDDLFVDLVALVARLGPERLGPREVEAMRLLPERRIAIIVPAWREAGIIGPMLEGNLARIDYDTYDVFVGVYPNDPATIEEVRAVARVSPRVHVVLNSRPGPTSKGQVLNVVLRAIRARERRDCIRYDAVQLQDSEDVVHPLALRLANRELAGADFVQIPVFSLAVGSAAMVAGTYVDEFAESHTKDLLVRNRLGAAIPSAGVGTALSRRLMHALALRGGGKLFDESTVTEDYAMGVSAHAEGYRARFVAAYYVDPSRGGKELIATREYFPKRLTRAIRQKTRWTVGIALQGARSLGWPGGLANRYFLLRERKAIATNVLALLGYPSVLAVAGGVSVLGHVPEPHLASASLLGGIAALNLFLMVNRVVQRTRCVVMVYGAWAALPIVLRWPVAVTINACAAVQALRADWAARVARATVAWAKTEHELPVEFGAARPGVEVS